MKLIVGLGNPGEKHKLNRHNVGWLVLDKLKQRFSSLQSPVSSWDRSKNAKALYSKTKISGEVVELIKPQGFMNKSGHSVSYAKNKHKVPLENIYIIYDDLDIKLGEYKIVKGKGPREHKGLLSIYDAIGSKDFWHVRVGIENREGKLQITNNKSQTNPKSQIQNSKQNTTHNTPSTKHIPGEKYVLMNFTEEEMTVVQDLVEEIADRLIELIKG